MSIVLQNRLGDMLARIGEPVQQVGMHRAQLGNANQAEFQKGLQDQALGLLGMALSQGAFTGSTEPVQRANQFLQQSNYPSMRGQGSLGQMLGAPQVSPAASAEPNRTGYPTYQDNVGQATQPLPSEGAPTPMRQGGVFGNANFDVASMPTEELVIRANFPGSFGEQAKKELENRRGFRKLETEKGINNWADYRKQINTNAGGARATEAKIKEVVRVLGNTPTGPLTLAGLAQGLGLDPLRRIFQTGKQSELQVLLKDAFSSLAQSNSPQFAAQANAVLSAWPDISQSAESIEGALRGLAKTALWETVQQEVVKDAMRVAKQKGIHITDEIVPEIQETAQAIYEQRLTGAR